MPDNNLITQFCGDNFDWNKGTPSGTATTHSTHGISIQEIKGPCILQTLTEIDKRKKRSISCAVQQLEPCFVNSKVGPNTLTHITSYSNNNINFKVEFSYFVWLLSRIEINEDCQSILGWNGWLSKISHCDKHSSIVDYMEPLSQHIMQIQQCKKF